MDSQTWELVARMVAILVAVGLGSVSIVAAVVVWWRKQIFGYGGPALCMAAVVLLGLSIWSSVKLAVSATSGIVFEGIAAGAIKIRGEEVTINNKSISISKGPTQISFWTPSARTKEARDVKDWEIVESDAKLDQFADRLIKAKILEGYRRHEVIGAGIGSRKIGAWWVSTNSGDFRLSEFLRICGILETR
jgi:hypothetical protein